MECSFGVWTKVNVNSSSNEIKGNALPVRDVRGSVNERGDDTTQRQERLIDVASLRGSHAFCSGTTDILGTLDMR